MGLKTHGTMAVDWEQRIDFDRLRRERLAGQGFAGQVRDGRVALFRYEQRALSDFHAHRLVGAGQGQPLHAVAAERRAHPVGFRLRRQASSIKLPVAR
jgi:hypothetical protein